MKRLFLLSALVVLELAVMGCNLSPSDNDTQSGVDDFRLTGTSWKLVGVVDTETNSLTELEPKNCDVCYTLTFSTDTTVHVYSTNNEGYGNYSVNYETHSINIAFFWVTAVNEMGDGNLWWKILEQQIETFYFQENELRLYYNGAKNYLLFKSKQRTDLGLTGTSWKLKGIVDLETNLSTGLEPQDCKECYTLIFDTDTTISFYGTINQRFGNYKDLHDNGRYSFSITDLWVADAGEIGSGNLWWDILQQVETLSFRNGIDVLVLYYNYNNGFQNCLRFKLQ